MKIVRPGAWIVELPNTPLHTIERAARISHRSEEAQTATSTLKFIDSVVLKHGDWSVVEHVSASVMMVVDRGTTHELVRHRLFSFTQESTRFVNYEKKMPPAFIYPNPEVNCQRCSAGNEALRTDYVDRWTHILNEDHARYTSEDCEYNVTWMNSIFQAEESYRSLLAQGWRPQEARSVLPNALAAKIQVTGNLRNWRHFFLMRTTKETHPQMRQVTVPLLAEFQQRVPLLFDDIVPGARQIDNLQKGR